MGNLLQNINYNIQGYHKDLTFDSKGDLTQVSYYQNYDVATKVFSNLKVNETRTYLRGVSTLLEERTMLIEWYSGNKIIATITNSKYYTEELGYKSNKRARQNLIDKASMYLLDAVGLADAKSFLNDSTTQISTYVDGNITPLLDVIVASTETYMTPTIKATLDVILNISY